MTTHISAGVRNGHPLRCRRSQSHRIRLGSLRVFALTAFPVLTVGVVIASMSGCGRSYYRNQADALVHDVVATGTANPRFQVPGFSIGIDPRSRLYDPTDPDFPPMPPDDPDASRLMVNVAGHKGYKRWHQDGDVPDVEVNDYRQWLPYGPDGNVQVDLVGAVKLARLHSREYQSQLETLYLSALDVTAERFRFYSQFYGGNTTAYTGIGAFANDGTDSSILNTTSNIQMQRMFTAGGTLMVELANSIVWQFAGDRSTTNMSLASFAFSQPLLQYAGKPRIMEQLTRVERNLLYNVRQYERYRQGFYLDFVAGSFNPASLSRGGGGLYGGSGLNGFTGVGVNGFGGVGAIGVVSSNNAAGGNGTGANLLGGFLGFLQVQQSLLNQRSRISSLRNTWLQLDAAFAAGRLESRFQVDFAQQAYYTGQSMFLNNTAAYETALDAFKMHMGLPPHIPLELKDPFFEQFNLINPDLIRVQEALSDRMELLSRQVQDGNFEVEGVKVAALASQTRRFIDQVTTDLRRMEANLQTRREALLELPKLIELQQIEFDSRALTPEAMQARIATITTDYSNVIEELQSLEQKSRELENDRDLTGEERIRAEREMLARVSASLLELQLLQARIRLHSITLVPITVTPESAFQLALTRRADWMNAKAGLIDTWRLVRFNANPLLTNITINVSGNLGTTGNNPIQFNGSNGQLTAGATLDLPITRVIERNVYRQSLIDYQQARRTVMQNRDEIHRGLRARLRQIRLDQFNLELRRLALDVSITQVDVARLKLVEPQKPIVDGKDTTASPTVARDLVDALQFLQDSQLSLITVWGDYELQRRQLDYEMGTMQLDENGFWRDPGSMTDAKVVELYYESVGNPLTPPDPTAQPAGIVELGSGDLPPDPKDIDDPQMPATDKDKK